LGSLAPAKLEFKAHKYKYYHRVWWEKRATELPVVVANLEISEGQRRIFLILFMHEQYHQTLVGKTCNQTFHGDCYVQIL